MVTDGTDEQPGGLLGLMLTAAVVGALTGLMAATFRRALELAARARLELVGWSRGADWWAMPVYVAAVVAAVTTAAWLVHRIEPHAEGSGIPRVEAVVQGRMEPGSFLILPVKYVGGVLALGSGMALGREGPCVQMGGNIGVIVATVLRRNRCDLRMLVAGGAAAGLATAFNSPLAGGVFVLEELLKRFDARATLAMLTCAAAGFASARLLVDNDTEFDMPQLAEPRLVEAPFVFVLGVLAGVAAVAYNGAIMGALRRVDASRWPVEARAACIALVVGLLGWFAPTLVGPGDNLTQQALLGHGTLWVVLGVLLLRMGLGVLCYTAGTPGGLFAPMLVLGSHLGLAVGLVGIAVAPQDAPEPAAMALIGLAAFFAASVHAPVTGLVLATEMTGATMLLPPMLGACAVAMLVATALRGEPIYDLLATRAARASQANRDAGLQPSGEHQVGAGEAGHDEDDLLEEGSGDAVDEPATDDRPEDDRGHQR
ncbi:CIC family chloride channel protein [Kineosphaera limosa]|uniref:Putative ClC chloride channel n=1 Tax=Kineosphaera limosa NBRC 100340 TaxID=1184609 RepID=K6W646_9MICO|nr:CIC family chloride channel protein [Kineosphaera limosa]GAB94655.1 putative ClC chloride channel [Kineosphaera limosa NBRC 100340]